ncbi:PIR Superfamily Protein [Plasmodium ovale curtisi]|uniref:PIR Superfamily Protein n=1 Tax=Plasmodium ovale curtisi TaxID=864141 RepID=A0A1A8XAY0_PLAOA|nr:PIR Superfamily Protein [Plasmodium ovale curtisi]
MQGSDEDERYDSFTEYTSNKNIYDRIKGNISEGFDSFPISDFKEYAEYESQIIMDSLKLKTYLMEFQNEKECQNKNCCQYMNHLLNYLVRTHYKSKKYIFNFYISYMNHVSDKIKNLCVSEIKYMDQDKYNQIDNLYKAYKTCQSFISNKYNSTSCYRAKSCSFAYNYMINSYTKINDSKYCKALKHFKHFLEENDITSTSKCNSENPNLLMYPDACNRLLQKSEQGTSSIDQQDRMLDGQIESKGPLDSQGDQMREIRADDTTSPSSMGATVPITLVSSGMGGLLILLSFYKFTPLRQWLKLRTQRFGGITKNFDEELYEMQQHTSKYNERNSEYNEYNIAYNSLEYS